MSRIKEMVKEMKDSNAYLEAEEFWNSQKVAVTFRLESDYLWRLDYLIAKLGGSRSSFAKDCVEAALIEAMEELGFDLETQKEMIFTDMKEKHDAIKAQQEAK
jgi:predicted DNA-binding protein